MVIWFILPCGPCLYTLGRMLAGLSEKKNVTYIILFPASIAESITSLFTCKSTGIHPGKGSLGDVTREKQHAFMSLLALFYDQVSPQCSTLLVINYYYLYT